MDKDKNKIGIGDNSYAYEDRYEGMLEEAVRFLDRLSNLVISANTTLTTKAINGRNVVVRANGLKDASVDMQKLVKETEDWHAVIETMKQGKDIHRVENCKSHKLEIVGNRGYNEFGQYLVDRSSPKFTKLNSDGRDYIKKITSNDN